MDSIQVAFVAPSALSSQSLLLQPVQEGPRRISALNDFGDSKPGADRSVAFGVGVGVAGLVARSLCRSGRKGSKRRAAKSRRGSLTRLRAEGEGSSLAQLSQRLVFFGGKGGVGKTSTSAAYAAGLAEQGKRVLVLSTDPAHSLGDALQQELSGVPCEIAENLWAAEVDTAAALQELREGLQSLDAKSMLDNLGLPGGTTAALGLEELSELLESPPPGVDEITAIAKAAAATEGYDVVVFDTAPTGHTLRMLDVPQFLGDFIDKALSIRKSLGGVLGMLGLGGNDKLDDAMDEAEVKVRSIRERITWLDTALHTKPDPGAMGSTAEFVVVTRPTPLDCAEAERLISDLRVQGVCCRRMIVNQVIEPDTSDTYWQARVEGQQDILVDLRSTCTERKLPLLEVSDRPEALNSVPALGYLAQSIYGNAPDVNINKVMLFGGKGGVGKTSMSSALSVHLAMQGKRVLAISTDPAHSLGDALDVKLGDKPVKVDTMMGDGELFAMEVDTAAAMSKFQDTVRESLKRGEGSGGIVGEVLKQLPMDDFVDLFDTLPPGSDEIVALVDILEEVKSETFDHIIIDMAPTGHALRLLSFPDFLERLADRVARLRERFGWLAGNQDGPDKLRSFQFSMIELQDLFTDPEKCSFSVVTIPTGVALAETKRLFGQLEEQDINTGMVLCNRIIDPERAAAALEQLMSTQQSSLDRLDAIAQSEDLDLKRIAYANREVRGFYGLKYLAANLVDSE